MREQKTKESQIVWQIKREMRKRGLSIRALSKLSLIAPSTIYDVLENRVSPRLITLQDICSALDMEIKVYKEPIYLEDDELFLSISNLTDTERKLAKEIIMLLDKYDKEIQ